MTGENFKRFHETKGDSFREKLESLEKKRSKIWGDFVKWCTDNPSGGAQPIDYERELKIVSFEIENVRYIMDNR